MSAYRGQMRGQIKITPFHRPQRANAEDYVAKTWSELRAAIVQIQMLHRSTLSFEQLYRAAYNLVLHKHGARLYRGVAEVISEHVAGMRAKIESVIETSNAAAFLTKLNEAYARHYKSMNGIRDILLYMDREYVNKRTQESSFRLGLSLFRDEVVRTARVNTALRKALLDLVEADRAGEIIDRSTLAAACQMLQQVSPEGGAAAVRGRHFTPRSTGAAGAAAAAEKNPLAMSSDGDIYEEDFERPLLEATRAFYRGEAQQFLRDGDAAAYLARSHDRLREETVRAQQCFRGSTLKRVVTVTRTQLLEVHGSTVLKLPGTGLAAMLDGDREADLRRAYDLFMTVPGGHDMMCALVKQHVTQRAKDIILRSSKSSGSKGAIELTESLLSLQDKYNGILAVAFTPGGGGGGDDMVAVKPKPKPKTTKTAKILEAVPTQTLTVAAAAGAGGAGTASVGVGTGTGNIRAGSNGHSDTIIAQRQQQQQLSASTSNARRPDAAFAKAVSSALHNALASVERGPECLSLYFDNVLRREAKDLAWDALDRRLDRGMSLFQLLEDKDLFERYYKRHLARRLLNSGRSGGGSSGYAAAVDDAERAMITKLKVECGYQFTHRLEQMFKDVATSESLISDYRKSLLAANVQEGRQEEQQQQQQQQQGQNSPLVELGVTIITTGTWPFATVPSSFPPLLERTCARFSAFYGKRHSGRVLHWHPVLGTAEVVARFERGTHILSVTTAAMIVLLRFNALAKGESVTLEDLEASCGLPTADLRRTLLTLACGKARVLAKSPRSGSICAGDKFAVNIGFTSKLKKVRIATITNKETTKERKETLEKAGDTRKYEIDAAIVRCMKARRQLPYSGLQAQVAEMLASRFRPQPSMVKKRIEDLIVREYIRRSEKDRRVYEYLA